MPERPNSRYTRAKTWAALYSQHLLASYAIVPFSLTLNSLDLIPCETPKAARLMMEELLNQAEVCEDFYTQPAILSAQVWRARPNILQRAIRAVVLARSSDYHHYHIKDHEAQFKLVVCGQHDSYLLLPCWETETNKTYRPRETAVQLDSARFWELRGTAYGHNIFVGALVCGDPVAIAMRDSGKLNARTRRRIKSEVQSIQASRYHGRPLAFMTEEERAEVNAKISASMKRYHEQRRLRIVGA